MRKKSNVLVLDTEASCLKGDFTVPLVYDIGYIIKDKNLNELVRRNYLVKEIWENKSIMEQAFYNSKVPFYEMLIENGEIEIKPLREILKIFVKDLKSFKVKTICAYNLAFDDKALTATTQLCASQELEKFRNEIQKRNSLCLWNLACDSFMQTEEYKNFCKENNLISEKGNYKTSAESAYQFITQDTTFIENHTALSDSEIEFKIFEYIMENCKGNITYGIFYNCWKKVQD